MESTTDQILQWAEEHATALEQEMHWERGDFGAGWWTADEVDGKARIRARAIAALAFLERFAGSGSRWVTGAQAVFDSKGERQSMESGARAIGDVLREWIGQVKSGQVRPRIAETAGVREVASTDLMGQVRALNDDKRVHPAAPIVLAGAALEIALRSAVEELGLKVNGRPGINNYAKALRTADWLTPQDMKEVEQMAGLRNDAAHGKHESLSTERAGLMEQQVNLFLRDLTDRLSTETSTEQPEGA